MHRALGAAAAGLLAVTSVVSADDTSLADSKQWQALLHFDREGVFSGPHSAVIDDGFFLAEDGPTNPHSELVTTLEALREDPASMMPGTHATCRFPARAIWLARQTGEHWPQAGCPRWDAWNREHGHDSVGLIFASGYLGNPASFFGHLMIQLSHPNDRPDSLSASQLLDTSLNFGADVPATDGLAMYMAKGLLGGYKAKFSNAPFYRNTTIYSEHEMRDLWDYELDLPEWERRLLIAHLYEILGQDYEYLFLSQNCASRIARTLEVVVDSPLTAGTGLWVAPESVIRHVSTTTINGEPLLKSVRHIPSRRLVTENRYLSLSAEEQAAAREVWPSLAEMNFDAERYRALTPRRQSAVIETLASHAAYLKESNDGDNITQFERQLLVERLQLPQGHQASAHVAPTPIHEATPSSTIRFQGVYNDSLGAGARVTLRPLLYDLLDGSTTRMPNAALEVGTVTMDITEGTPSLRDFTLFSITNLEAGNVPLPGSSGFAWHASGGAYRTSLGCNDCLDGHVTLLAGKSAQLGKHLPFAMVGGRLRTQRNVDGPLAPAFQAGMLTEWSERQRTIASASYIDALSGSNGRRMLWQLEYRYALGKAVDARVEAQQDEEARELAAGLSFYF